MAEALAEVELSDAEARAWNRDLKAARNVIDEPPVAPKAFHHADAKYLQIRELETSIEAARGVPSLVAGQVAPLEVGFGRDASRERKARE